MSIFDMFRGTPAPAQVEQIQQAKQTQQDAENQQQTNGLPVVQPNPAAKEQEVSGLDRFKDLWQTPVKKEGEEDTFDPSNLFDLDPAKLQAGLKGFDTTKGISPDDLKAIAAGGEDAIAALGRVLNASSQATLQAAITAAGGMTQSAISRSIPSLDGKIKSTVRDTSIGTHLRTASPLMKNEAAKPMLSALATQFAGKHPDASPEEIVAMVDDYMITLSESMGMQRPGATSKQMKASEEKDWGKWFTE